jgi:hypothetical protein
MNVPIEEVKKRKTYQTRFKRIWFNSILAGIFAVIATTCFYYAWQLGQGGWNWASVSLGTLCFVFLLLFADMFKEARQSIIKRGYERAVSVEGNTFAQSVASIFQGSKPDTIHPILMTQALKKRVWFDGGSYYDVDIGQFYFILLTEVKHTNIFPWTRCVAEQGMNKKAWAAYRKILEDYNLVDKNGRGELRLNCTPLSAIEIIKNR